MRMFSSVLVDIDATARVQPALEQAVEVARRCGARLRIVDVSAAPSEVRHALSATAKDDLIEFRRDNLARLAHAIRGVDTNTDILWGTPAEALVEDVDRFGHDLLVRSHARDIAARGIRPFGPINVELFRRCRCPVWA